MYAEHLAAIFAEMSKAIRDCHLQLLQGACQELPAASGVAWGLSCAHCTWEGVTRWDGGLKRTGLQKEQSLHCSQGPISAVQTYGLLKNCPE